jgi:hypothetical protein
VRCILVLPALLALSSCQPKPTDPPADAATTDAPFSELPPSDPPATSDDVVQLSPLEKQVSVTVGSSLTYSFNSHSSVGYGAEQTCSDESIVRYVRTDTVYEQSEAERAGKTGADAATGTFVFEAVAPGTATVTVDELFRGSVEQSTTFTIVVSE